MELRSSLILLLLSISIVFTSSCESAKQEVSATANHVKGVLSNYQGEQLLLELVTPNSISSVDTLIVEEDGSFSLTPDVRYAAYYRISQSPSNFCVFVLYPGDTIELNADVRSLEPTYTVLNSPESESIKNLNNLLADFSRVNDSLQQAAQTAQQSMNFQALDQIYSYQQSLNMNVGRQIQLLINENPSSFAAMSAVQNFDPNRDYQLFAKVEEAWKADKPSSPYLVEISQKLEKIRTLQVGAIPPNISLPNPDGEMTSLYDLRGKVVLLDFWASWCKPCRAENPNVVKAYNKYKDKGFEILGVSLDQEKPRWLQAIQADGLTWTHVSDLKGWQSAGAALYNVQSIPAAFLLDAEGKIIARDLRGPALDKKLEEILGT